MLFKFFLKRITELISFVSLAKCFPGLHVQNDWVWSRINEKWIFVGVEDSCKVQNVFRSLNICVICL